MQLTVWPQAATFAKETDTFSKTDPYVEVKVGQQVQRTRVIEEGGRNPRWNDQLNFTATLQDNIRFRIFDKDVAKTDDFIGEVNVPVSKVKTEGKGNFQSTIPFHSTNNSGTLTVRMATAGGYPPYNPNPNPYNQYNACNPTYGAQPS